MPGPRVITTIQVEDDRLNRWQRHVADTLNPVLRQIGSPPLVTGARAGADAVTLSLLAALEALGLVRDGTT